MGTTRFASRTLVASLALATLLAGVAAVRWSSRYRLGTSWDESDYLNQVVRLVQDARGHGVAHAARQVRWTDNIRPPAYRVVAFPVGYWLGSDPRTLRALSLAAFVLTGVLVYGGARLVSDSRVAMLAGVVMVVSYAPLWASAHFGTEYVLYVAVAGMFYGLLYFLIRPPAPARSVAWMGLTAALALGALSKTSFALIAVPAVLTFLAVAWRFGLPARDRWAVGAASCAALLLVAPWWIVNARSAIAYARYASAFIRHSFPWLSAAFWTLLGPPVTALLVALLVVVAVRWRLVRGAMTPQALAPLAVCVAGAAPLFVAHLLGMNHNMRLVSPALVPAILAVALIAQASAALELRHAAAAAGVVIVLQGAYMWRQFATADVDQWDWEPLRALSTQHGLPFPDIRYLGNGSAFNPPAIAYPWVLHGDSSRVSWLWRFEDGPPDWARIAAERDSADIVLTAPGFTGVASSNQPRDNRYNSDFAETLKTLPEFEPPVELHMGPDRTGVLVFFRRRGPAASRGPAGRS